MGVDASKIVDEAPVFALSFGWIRMSKECRRVDRHKHGVGKRRAPRPSSQFVEPNGLAEDGLGGGDAKADDDAWLHELCFRLQPGPTGRNFGG